ncbi:methyl-accepting chemotaxis protein [Chitinimonas koreensis]|uniref:methyl-accepting chemotaxis protein n=1 Tax=Chitinimonas koreensis TaxID=356302 RepID=UPI00041F9EDD|nr:methyl-accepting chemotaxis protein [Chitinimonas koreensis]QNM98441.1 methyl-accepting chemotaxis protein [Chitinimonas koreensis]
MFQNLKISARLTALSLLLLGLVVVVLILGRIAGSTATSRLASVYHQHAVPMAELGQGLDDLHRSRMLVVLALEAYNQKNAEENFRKMATFDQSAMKHLEPAFALAVDEAGKQQVAQFKTNWADYLKFRDTIVKLYNDGDRAQALTEFRTNLTPAFETAADAVTALLKRQAESTSVEYEEADRLVGKLSGAGMAVALFGLLTAAALSFWIIRSITTPLRQSVKLAEKIAAGDLTTAIRAGSRDETGQLLAALATMQAQLREMIGGIGASSADLSQAAHQIHGAYTGIRDGSIQQSDASSSIAAAVEQMSVGFDHLASRAGNALAQAETAHRLSEHGARQVGVASGEVERIAASVNSAAQTMGRLEEHSVRISGIAATIKEIADQTNLLALNAAIEAARAGEAGRGFAVVADEVRKLAEKTGAATSDIMAALGSIKTETAEVIGAMRGSAGQIDNGVHVIRALVPSLNELKEGADHSRSELLELDGIYREQASASQSIAQHVESIARMTEQTNLAIGRSAETVEQLETLAEHLRGSVARFRL